MISNKTQSNLFSAGAVFIIVGLLLFLSGFYSIRRKRIMENTPTSKIRSLAMGLAEIYGESTPWQKTLTTPLSGKPCLYYRLRIEEYREHKSRHGLVTGSWEEIFRTFSAVPFLLKDETGAVLVDPKGAGIEIPGEFSLEFDTAHDTIPDNLLEVMAQKNITAKASFGAGKKLTFSETYIAPGSQLYIMGTVGDNPHVEETRALTNIEDVMIQKGSKGSIYLISNKSEKKQIESMKSFIPFAIFGGTIMFLAGISLLYFYFTS